MAKLVDELFEPYQIRLLGFDIVMAEPDESSGLHALEALGKRELKGDAPFQQALQRLRARLDYDSLFAASLRQRPVILGYYLSNEGSTSGALPAGTFDGHDIAISAWRNHSGNLALFQQAAASAGHFNPIIDPDGSIRRVPMLAYHEGAYYEAFSLAMARAYFNGAALAPQFGADAGPDGAPEALGGPSWSWGKSKKMGADIAPACCKRTRYSSFNGGGKHRAPSAPPPARHAISLAARAACADRQYWPAAASAWRYRPV